MKLPRLLLFASTTGYQIRAFAEAAERVGVEFTLATDRCHVLDDPWGDRAVAVKFGQVEESLLACVKAAGDRGFDAVAAVGDGPAILAAEAAAAMHIPFHPPAAVRACQDKYLARQKFQAAGLRVPEYFRVALAEGAEGASGRAIYPCVLKPLGLSGSCGVIRANDEAEFRRAFARIKALLEKSPDIRMADAEQAGYMQVETYIPGREFAVEGIVTRGMARVLAIFDKPDPLEGPFFEETIYVTPSRESGAVQEAIRDTVERAVAALGLEHGPFHAELRVKGMDLWMLEVAARPIGGLCAKALRFSEGTPSEALAQNGTPRAAVGTVESLSFMAARKDAPLCALEELILRHAMGEDVTALQVEGGASGVMMIPIPAAGVYQDASGVDEARAVAGVEDVVITAKAGQALARLPEGRSYLGFIFARSSEPAAAEQALREAHGRLRFRIAKALPTVSAG